MSADRPHATLPTYLRPETVGTMPLDEPRYVAPDLFRPSNEDGVVICGYELLDRKTRRFRKLQGRVALMLTTASDYSEEGYVADFRMLGDHETIAPAEDLADAMFEEDDDDIEELDCEHPIRALVARNPRTGEIDITGDKRFLPALYHLSEIVDTNWEWLASKGSTKQSTPHSTQPSSKQSSKKEV